MHSLRPAVTVIVPVHGVARYIEKCATSLFEQTLKNIEILFINDCSPDNSTEIIKQTLEKYPNRKNSTKIINLTSNAGLAGARKQGINNASGDYIIHCDGDDWVDPSLYEKMYSTAITENSDVVICDLVEEFQERSIRHKQIPSSYIPQVLLKNWYKNVIHMSCCNKLFKRTIYNDNSILPWTGLNMWEDNALTTRLLYYATKISYISEEAYHYNRTNLNAITSGYGIRQVEQMIEVASNLEKFFIDKPDFKDYKKTVDAFKYFARINLITDSFRNYNRYKNTFPESKYIVPELDKNAFSSKGRIRFNMVRFGLAPLFIIMFKLKKAIHK